jgi:hypothetical protein
MISKSELKLHVKGDPKDKVAKYKNKFKDGENAIFNLKNDLSEAKTKIRNMNFEIDKLEL